MISKGHRFAQGKPFRIPERAILSACRQVARLHEAAGRLVCIRVSNSGILQDGGRKMVSNPDMLGIPDLIVLLKDGPDLWVELKAEDGRLSAGQVNFAQRIGRVGRKHHVVRSVDEFEALLAAYGVPRLTLLPS